MKKFNLTECFVWTFAVLPALATLAVYPWLPEQVPLQWGFDGVVNRYGARIELFGICVLAFGIQLLMRFSPKLDPKGENYARFGNAYKIVRLALALFFAAMQGIVLYSCLVPGGGNISVFVTTGVGILFCIMGNFMPKFKHNYFIGIRTPWTLENETVWYATHRLAGPIWVLGGIVIAVSAFLLTERTLFIVVIGCACGCGLIPYAYSYYLFRKSK